MSKILKAAKILIKESGLSQAEIARRLDIPQPRVNELMNKTEIRGLTQIERVIELLKPNYLDDMIKRFSKKK